MIQNRLRPSREELKRGGGQESREGGYVCSATHPVMPKSRHLALAEPRCWCLEKSPHRVVLLHRSQCVVPAHHFHTMVMRRVKTLEALPPGLCMAKRLTKALRGKRRWVGLVTAHSLQSRNEIERKVEEVMKELNLSKAPRLMDFFRPDSETSRHFCTQNPNLSLIHI